MCIVNADSDGLQSTSDGLQPTSASNYSDGLQSIYIYTIDGLQPKRDDLQPNAMLQQTVYTVNALAMASNLAAMSSNLLGPATY